MKKISFSKMVASGNDFVVVDRLPVTGYRLLRLLKKSISVSLRGSEATEAISKKGLLRPFGARNDSFSALSLLAKYLCGRKYGAGADGMLLLEKSKKADVRMRIFNADGSEAEMCGNGARCIARFVVRRPYSVVRKKILKIQTKAGIIEAEVSGERVKIKLTDPIGMKLGIPLGVSGRSIKVNFINTGVPHAVVFVEGLKNIDVDNLGRFIRYHKRFAPAGTNVNFVEVLDTDTIAVRTYERGVEGETLACGTGSVASALLIAYSLQLTAGKINVHTKGGETLKVYFERIKNNFHNVWLEGRAKIVYKGEYYV